MAVTFSEAAKLTKNPLRKGIIEVLVADSVLIDRFASMDFLRDEVDPPVADKYPGLSERERKIMEALDG